MNPDGSQKTLVLTAAALASFDHPDIIGPPATPPGSPCDQVYGSDSKQDRWYLGYAPTARYDRIIIPDGRDLANPDRYDHYDVFAYRTDPANRSQLQVVQVTNLFGEGWTEYGMFGAGWSNDSNESATTSHISSSTIDLGDCFVVETDEFGDPVYTIDFRIDPSKWHPATGDFMHIPVTAGEIQTAWNLDLDLDLTLGDAELRPFYTSPLSVSPNRTEFVSAENNQLVIRSMADGSLVRTVWNGSQGIQPTTPSDPVWCRDGATIVFHNGGNNYSRYGGCEAPGRRRTAPAQLIQNSVVKGQFGSTRAGWRRTQPICLRYRFDQSASSITTDLMHSDG
jgi:hypothetical protein